MGARAHTGVRPEATPTPEAIRRRDVLSSFCDPIAVPESRDWVGCVECPSFTGSPEQGITAGAAFQIEEDYFGSFSQRGAAEALLSFSGCEVRAMGMGGVLLLRYESRAWRIVSYTAGPMRDCQRTEQDGRTLFLCRSGSAWQGYVDENVEVHDYGNPRPPFLFNVSDNTGSACLLGPRQGVFYSGNISAVGWLDLNHDGWLDVAATISFSSEIWHTPPTEDGCAHEGELMSDRLESSATRSRLEFINTGTDFRPSPSTQQILADIEVKTRYRPPPRPTPAPPSRGPVTTRTRR